MKIRSLTYKSGRLGYQLDMGVVNGRRVQMAFPSEKEAETEKKKQEKLRAIHGSTIPEPSQLALLRIAMDKLNGANLLDAVDFYMHHRPEKPEIALPDLIDLYLKAKAGKSKRTVETMKCAMRPLRLMFPLKLAHELAKADIEGWLAGSGYAPKTVATRIGFVCAFLNWAKANGYLASNVIEGMERPDQSAEEITSLDVTTSHRLLKAAASEESKPLLGYIALGLFAGIRRAEMERMTWDSIDLDAKTAIISSKQSKTRARRVVDLPENAVAWLKLCTREGRIVSGSFKERWPAFKREHKLDLPDNSLRHTFASMHYAKWQNEFITQSQMGHTSARMLHQHYRGLRTKAEGEAFFSLTP